MNPITYSHLQAFETCPQQFYRVKVARDVPDPPNEAARWGDEVHTAFELAVRDSQPLPPKMAAWEPLVARVAALPGEKLAETRLAVGMDFQPAPWKQSWVRGIADLVAVHKDRAAVLDYKTGKRKPSEQLDLYAAMVFAHYPQVNVVMTGYVWLKERKVDRSTIHRAGAHEVWQHLLPRIARLQAAHETGQWPERPSGLCRGWCPVKSCAFYRERG